MELFRLLGTIAVDNTNANRAIDDTTRNAQSGSNETSKAFSKIGSVAGTLAKGIGIAGAAMGGAWIAVIESTREYREQMGLLDTAFQKSGLASSEAKSTYSDLNAVLGDTGQAVEASQHIALLADNEKELNTWTNICTGVYATFGASLPIEGLTEAANETAKTGLVTGSLADALNWAGISEDDFNEKLAKCTTEQQRQDLIMNTLNGTYEKASETYKATNKDVMDANRANEKLSDAMAKLGAVGEPIMTLIKTKVAEMVSAAVPLLENMVEKFKDIVQWVKENETTVTAWVAVIVGATVSVGAFLLIMKWSAIMSAASKAIKGVTLAVKALNLAMKANLIGLIVSLILGLVAAFVILWKKCDGFRNFWIKLWNTIKSSASKAWSGIKSIFSGIGTWFTGKFEQVQKAGKSAMTKLKRWFSDAWKSIKNVFSGWGSFFGGLWTKIKNKFGSIGSSLGKAMGSAVKSGMNAVISTIEKTINKGIGLINSAIKLANKLPMVNVGTLPKMSLPRLAEGGVLKKGQVGLLEGSGAEAVVPLEKNTGWLDEIADRLAWRTNTGTDVTGIQILMERIVRLLEELKQMEVCLDSGALVGELTPQIDSRLGNIYAKTNRRNTR